MWSFKDTSETPEIKDDTIEPPSEAAQRAREEVKAKARAEASSEQDQDQEPLLAGDGETVTPDDSWMNEPVGLPDADGKLKKRKNKKK